MSRRRVLVALTSVLLVGTGFGMDVASAHQCREGDTSKRCKDTAVYEDWRPNFVPLFDLEERDEATKEDAQRWRQECEDDGEYRQQCVWLYGGQSGTVYESDPDGSPRPNEQHVGVAATHCFLAEAAHDCDRHGDVSEGEFGTHDSHGGAVYVDLCLAGYDNSRHCDEGMKDTQAGVTVVDHLDCPLGCFDEYHVVRPFDEEYTAAQTDDSLAAVEQIVTDPKGHLCGYPAHTTCP